MKKGAMFLTVIIFFSAFWTPVQADDATPASVLQKTREAADYIVQNSAAALQTFNDQNGPWVWGGTYVFVLKCTPFPSLVTHPIKPGLIGRDLSGLKDKNGNYFFIQLCDAASQPEGGWVEYLWPKPGEKKPSRKISYCMDVPGTEYGVGAGIYDDSISMEKLNSMVK